MNSCLWLLLLLFCCNGGGGCGNGNGNGGTVRAGNYYNNYEQADSSCGCSAAREVTGNPLEARQVPPPPPRPRSPYEDCGCE